MSYASTNEINSFQKQQIFQPVEIEFPESQDAGTLDSIELKMY